MKKIKRVIQNYFGFSPKETKGFLGIIIVMIILLMAPIVHRNWAYSSYSNVEDQKELDSIIYRLESNVVLSEKNSYAKASPQIKFKLFRFDPNLLELEGFLKLGLNRRLSERIINYRNKGGKFFVKSDFKKMYGLSDKQYGMLYPFIDLPETGEFFKKNSTKETWKSNKITSAKTIKIDINLADTAQLIALKGIGEKLAKRIVVFRDKLGGFINKDQLKEVYGLDSANLMLLQEQTSIDENFAPKKININADVFESMKNHPYLRFKLAKLIIAYREQHGPYTSVEDLKKIKSVKEEEWKKALPYLTF